MAMTFLVRLDSPHLVCLPRRQCYWHLRIGGPLLCIIIIKKPRECDALRLCRDTLFQFPCILVDKTEQDMITTHRLAYMTDARMFRPHPGVDHLLKRRHAISTLGAIKAFVSVHHPYPFGLAVHRCTISASQSVFYIDRKHCNILPENLLIC